MDIISQIDRKLTQARRPLIVIHMHPDGDALGSALALARILRKEGKDVQIVSPDAIPDFLQWMPDMDTVLQADRHPDQARQAFRQADLIVMLDHNKPSRTGDLLEPMVEEALKDKDFVMIDHHLEPDPRIPLAWSLPGMSSTAEMVYDFLKQTGRLQRHGDPQTATQLYTGIMTDTGSFRFGTTTGDTHRAIADLIDMGADNENIHVRVFDTFSYDKLQLLAHALQNMKYLPDCGATYMVLDKPTLEKFNHRPGYTEGIVNYGLSLDGVNFTALIKELPGLDRIRLSFRSKGDFDVNRFARRYFEGGGHKNAAGGQSFDDIPTTVRRLEEAIRQHCREIAGK
ncbi:MAG: bifunctional oligoribonuclease/PAP phosphatase NrnA [Chlorobi bacterium]|nr:bifunctional oligoribonuclease/PAP phosphatase NrnA [Chlorobiota bacterium]